MSHDTPLDLGWVPFARYGQDRWQESHKTKKYNYWWIRNEEWILRIYCGFQNRLKLITKHQIVLFGRKKWQKHSWPLKNLWWWTNVRCMSALCTILCFNKFWAPPSQKCIALIFAKSVISTSQRCCIVHCTICQTTTFMIRNDNMMLFCVTVCYWCILQLVFFTCRIAEFFITCKLALSIKMTSYSLFWS